MALPYTYASSTASGGTHGTFDWKSFRAHLFHDGAVLSDFNAVTRQLLATTDVGAQNVHFNVTCICTANDERVYSGTSDSANLVLGYNPVTATIDKVFDDVSGILPAAGFIAPFTEGGDQYVAIASLNAGQGGGGGAFIYAVNMSTLASAGFLQRFAESFSSIAPGNGRLCRGPAGNCFGMAYNEAATVIGVYSINASGATRVGSFTPANVVGGGTTFAGMSIPGFDETDGNLLVCVIVSGTNYLCKINSTTGAVMWATALASSVDLNEASVKHGTLQLISINVTPTLYVINTATGAIISSTTPAGMPNENGETPWNDSISLLISCVNTGISNIQWETFGPPPPPRVNQGGVIRING